MPLRSVLVTPVCPTSWMEMAGLDVDEWIGRTVEKMHTGLLKTNGTPWSEHHGQVEGFNTELLPLGRPCSSERRQEGTG